MTVAAGRRAEGRGHEKKKTNAECLATLRSGRTIHPVYGAAAKLWSEAAQSRPEARRRPGGPSIATTPPVPPRWPGAARARTKSPSMTSRMRNSASRPAMAPGRAGRLDETPRIGTGGSPAFVARPSSTGRKTRTSPASARRKLWRPCPRPNAKPRQTCGPRSTRAGQGAKSAGAHWRQMTLRYRPFPFNLSESTVGIQREAGSKHRRSPGESTVRSALDRRSEGGLLPRRSPQEG